MTAQPAPATSLPKAIDAELSQFASPRAGRLAYYSDTSAGGRPLLLFHSINAAPSSREVQPLFDHYRALRPVYSLDLPGFGQSERGERPYSPELYSAAIGDMLAHIGDEPADVLALSLSAEFTARATLAAPERVASLVLISPTGFSRRPLPPPAVGRVAHGVLNAPGLGRGLFGLVSSKPSIRFYLSKSFTGAAPEALVDYAWLTSHQPGARHAPLTFLSSRLFTPNAVERLYERLTELPVLAIADRDPYVTFERIPEVAAAHPNWHYEHLAPNMGLPHWEHPDATFAVLDRFWGAAS
jgi:pimeloyl-ACP methyl ester carboxylesterase